ncbi:MAG: hypothetical protein ACRD4P_06875, partial [Bryobacteraceae bacterium]
FRGTDVSTEWPARLVAAQQKIDAAKNDNRQLTELEHGYRRDARTRAEQLLADERNLRDLAVRESAAVEASADKWLGFQRNLSYSAGNMKTEYDAVKAVDLSPVAATVERTEHDWPARKGDLDSRLASLRGVPQTIEAKWQATEAARKDAIGGKATGTEIASLIEEDDFLSQEKTGLPQQASELSGLCGQLYDSWDKILTDLDVSHYADDTIYREKVRIVRTHFTDLAAKKSEVSSNESWKDVPEASYQAVKNDLGMAIGHKDTGNYDSEAQAIAQPAGFAYIASATQGSNQYGYWAHNGGTSVWTFLPQYLLMRELLWGHDHRPVLVDEYNGYRTAQSSGQTYYGKDSATSQPRYGSHGTFTQQRYASSRYVQSGGFNGSSYASHGAHESPTRFGRASDELHRATPGYSSAGRRFGSRPGSSGRRFGSLGRSRSLGRSFGRHR